MNLAHQNRHHFLVHLTRDELVVVSNALNEVCHGVDIDDAEFQARLSVSRPTLQALVTAIDGFLTTEPEAFETVTAEADGCSVQVRCVSAQGGAVDMSSVQARDFAGVLTRCADDADANVR